MYKPLFFLLILSLFTACKSPPPVNVEEEEPAIEIKEPEFEVVSIAIIQADLVNTKFEAVLRINNPNKFDVNLSSLKYELYGNGILWSSGTGKDILFISAESACETEFLFTMNFINMKRNLLDDIIARRMVNYRFAGVAEVETGAPLCASFQASFDRSGLSEVKEKVENSSGKRL